MSWQHIYKRIHNLSNTPSSNDKIDLLNKYLENETFLAVIKLMYDGTKHYHIKSFPKFVKKDVPFLEKKILKLLVQFTKQTGVTNIEKQELFNLCSVDEETFEVMKMVCKKDASAGFSAKLINKARPKTITIIPYARCSTDKKIEKITYPAIIQEKADGMFVNVMINHKGQIKIITRNGKTVHQLKMLKQVIRKGRGLPPKKAGKTALSTQYGILNNSLKEQYFGMVYTGELLVKKEGKILPRKTGNGILNSCIHGTANPEDIQQVIFHVWDCLPLKDFYEGFYDVVYNTREFNTSQFVNAVNDKEFVNTVMTERVNSYEEAQRFYAEVRKTGGEGAILKNLDSVWKDHTSPNMVKLKNVIDFDLIITGWKRGKEGTKYESCMGAIQCESSCGKLKVFVGTGFSDKERKQDWDKFTRNIVTISCESVIQDKRKNTHSLFLPRFVDIREDLNKAQSLNNMLTR